MRIYSYIPIAPVGKGRPRFGNGKVYTPDTTKYCEEAIRLHMNKYNGQIKPKTSLKLTLDFHMPKPQKYKEGSIPFHNVRPDLDNMIKLVLDALNKGVIPDDAQVSIIKAQKIYSAESAIVLIIEEIE